MIERVNESDFLQRFRDFNRYDSFGYDALVALYEHLIELEEDLGEEIELDVIGLCCDFSAYESFEDWKSDYGDNTINDVEELREHTMVIEHDEGIIVQAF